MPKRILIAIPVRDSLTIPSVNGLLGSFAALVELGYELVPAICQGCYIGQQRSDLAAKARAEKCEEICFIDSDVGYQAAHLVRLLGHEGVDVVAGCYAKRKPGPPEWTAYGEPGSKPDERGLQRATSVGAGFLRVKMSVFDELDRKFPNRRYQHVGEEERTEYFPTALTVRGSHLHPAEAKLEAIRALIHEQGAVVSLPDEILAIIERKEPCELLGEDVAFCRLVRAAGFMIWADVALRLGHEGVIQFPAQQLPL